MRRIVALAAASLSAFSMLQIGGCGLDSDGAAGPSGDAMADLFAPDVVQADVVGNDATDGGVIVDASGDVPVVPDAVADTGTDAPVNCGAAFTCEW